MKASTQCLISCILLLATPLAQSAVCPFDFWTDYQGVKKEKKGDVVIEIPTVDKLLKNKSGSAYLFATAHIAIDADGAPNAYHPDGIGLDKVANAGYPNSDWWADVLVPDPENPKVAYQQPAGEFAGYFVSKTSLEDKSKDDKDPVRYVDATTIPYLVFPGAFYKMKGTGRRGDKGFAINTTTGKMSSFVVADIGPYRHPLGEVSIALAENISGQSASPRTGLGRSIGRTIYVVFPYTSKTQPWPFSVAQMDGYRDAFLKTVGGIDAIRGCVGSD